MLIFSSMVQFIKRSIVFLVFYIPIAAASGVIHEYGHVLGYEAAGVGSIVNFREAKVDVLGGSEDSLPHWQFGLGMAGGPVFTLLLALLFYWGMRFFPSSPVIFAAALSNSTYRYLGLVASVWNLKSDEWNLSLALGLPALTVPILMALLCVLFTVMIIQRSRYFIDNNYKFVLLLAALPINLFSFNLGFRIVSSLQ